MLWYSKDSIIIIVKINILYFLLVGYLNVCFNVLYNYVWWSKNSGNLDEGIDKKIINWMFMLKVKYNKLK